MADEPERLAEIRQTAAEHPRWAQIHGWAEMLTYLDERERDWAHQLETANQEIQRLRAVRDR